MSITALTGIARCLVIYSNCYDQMKRVVILYAALISFPNFRLRCAETHLIYSSKANSLCAPSLCSMQDQDVSS